MCRTRGDIRLCIGLGWDMVVGRVWRVIGLCVELGVTYGWGGIWLCIGLEVGYCVEGKGRDIVVCLIVVGCGFVQHFG